MGIATSQVNVSNPDALGRRTVIEWHYDDDGNSHYFDWKAAAGVDVTAAVTARVQGINGDLRQGDRLRAIADLDEGLPVGLVLRARKHAARQQIITALLRSFVKRKGREALNFIAIVDAMSDAEIVAATLTPATIRAKIDALRPIAVSEASYVPLGEP